MQAKRKREEDREKEEKIKNGINKYFNAKTTAPAPKAKVPPNHLRLFRCMNFLTQFSARCFCRGCSIHGRSPG
jgi:hypothetical protein